MRQSVQILPHSPFSPRQLKHPENLFNALVTSSSKSPWTDVPVCWVHNAWARKLALIEKLACTMNYSAPREELMLPTVKQKKKKKTRFEVDYYRPYRAIVTDCPRGGTVTPFGPEAEFQGGARRAVLVSVDLLFQAVSVTRSYIGLFCCCDMVSIDVHWNCAQLRWSQEPCNLEVV